jgi:SAM-dependent methyltransferase
MNGARAASDDSLVQQCSELFSNEYGIWSELGEHPGEHIHMPPSMVRAHLQSDDAWIACAFASDTLVGYCIALRFVMANGPVAWITQLVVAENYRRAGIATQMMYSMWQFSDCFAWGLVTANPYAVRALETATRRSCRTSLIASHADDLLEDLSDRVKYIPDHLVTTDSGRRAPCVDTQFFVDHSELASMRRRAARRGRRWNLGTIDEGQEWFACTFGSQTPNELDEAQLDELLKGSDRIWIDAYEGMTLDDNHTWHHYTSKEIGWILQWSNLGTDKRILDVGCGDGRHTLELRKRGFIAYGIDISDRLIGRAGRPEEDGFQFFSVGDCREGDQLPEGPFDLVLCLYDVLGSSASSTEDLKLLRAVKSRMRSGGILVGSVMNSGAVLPHMGDQLLPEGRQAFIESLEKLEPSRTMEQTGSVFDPALMIFFDDVFYRKEQFDAASWRLPSEVVVRDLRYSVVTLTALLETAGFSVDQIFPVQAGRWDRVPPLDEEDTRAKEILFLARLS